MKKAFSRLITFINHLLAYLVSTLVKRWLNKSVIQIHVYNYMVDSQPRVIEADGFTIEHNEGEKILVVVAKEVRYDIESGSEQSQR